MILVMRRKSGTKKVKNKDIVSSLITKKIDLKNLKVLPTFSIDSTKKKIGNLYSNYKKEKEKAKLKAEKNRKLEEKKELLRQKKKS